MTNASKQWQVQNLSSKFCGKKVQNHVLVCGVLRCDPSARPKKFSLVGTDR